MQTRASLLRLGEANAAGWVTASTTTCKYKRKREGRAILSFGPNPIIRVSHIRIYPRGGAWRGARGRAIGSSHQNVRTPSSSTTSLQILTNPINPSVSASLTPLPHPPCNRCDSNVRVGVRRSIARRPVLFTPHAADGRRSPPRADAAVVRVRYARRTVLCPQALIARVAPRVS